MSATRGKDYKLYYNSDAPYDNTPTWVEVENVRDLARNLEKALADASIRGSSFRLQLGTMKDLSLEFQMVSDYDDAAYAAFEDAFFGDANIEFLVLNGARTTDGVKGIRFMGQVSNFSENQNLEDVGLTDVTVVPAYYPTNLPRRVAVAGGVVTDV